MDIRSIIPSLFTAGSLLSGFVSILYTFEGNHTMAAALIILSLFLDAADGNIARKLNRASVIGMQLDSLSDLVAFGVAPAFLMYAKYFMNLPMLWTLVPFSFVLAGAFRLARYNTLTDHSYFTGLPIPAAATFLVAIQLADIQMKLVTISFLIVFLAYLMASKIPYPRFTVLLSKEYYKNLERPLKSRYLALFLVGFVAVLTLTFLLAPNKVVLLPFLYYVIVGPILEMRH